jgi:uncharacterized protein
MSQYPNDYAYRREQELDYSRDGGAIFNFFNAVYAWMCVGLGVTAATAWLVSSNLGIMQALYSRGASLAFLLGGVLICFGIRAAAHRISPGAATVLFLIYAAIIGAMFAPIFIIYKLGTLAAVFAITAGTFGVTSVFGYVTKKDLSGLRGILFMSVAGLFIATAVNIFMGSALLSYAISYVGVVVFVALTAYDTQKLREIAYATQGDPREAAKYAIVGSLELYLDFVNMFLFLLRILGDRR